MHLQKNMNISPSHFSKSDEYQSSS